MTAKKPQQDELQDVGNGRTAFGRQIPTDMTLSGSFDLTRIEPLKIGRLLQIIPIPALFVDQSSQIVFANESCRKIRLDYQTLRGCSLLSLFGEAAPGIQTLLQEVFSTRKTLVGEAKLRTEDGNLWGRLTFRPASIAGKRLALLLVEDMTYEKGAILDALRHQEELESINEKLVSEIRQREQSEEALRESEARFREFADSMPQAVCELDANGNFTFISRRALKAAGYRAEDLASGLNFMDLLAPVDRERAAENLRTILDRKTDSGNEYVALRKDGTTLPVIVYTNPIVKDGNVRGFRSVVVDVTEQREAERVLKRSRDELEKLVADRTAKLEAVNKQLRKEILERKQAQQSLSASEERFRGIIETARDCVFIKNLSLAYTFVNPYMTNLLDVPESEIVGKTDEDLFGVAAGKHLREVDCRVLEGEVIEEEHTRPVKGAPMTFLDVRAPLTNSEGRIIGICGIARNVTERKVLVSSELAVDSEYVSPPMRATIATARLAAASDSTVLLTGESGSGKDYLARYIHEHSQRSSGPFYSINCAAIPRQLAESELFGYEAGAFTGAARRKRGMIELAEGGTLLLNEVSELRAEIQSKLLTFFDTMSFTRVGGQTDVRVNVRLLAAANIDLYREAVEGRFRKDLYYRLNVFTIRVPPLKERIEDLPVIMNRLLSELATRMGFPAVPRYDDTIIEMLGRYDWPGNVRELRNVLERALILSQGKALRTEHMVLEKSRAAQDLPKPDWPRDKPFEEIVGSVQRELIGDALKECGGNKSQSAHRLGMSRFALARHIKKLKLDEL